MNTFKTIQTIGEDQFMKESCWVFKFEDGTCEVGTIDEIRTNVNFDVKMICDKELTYEQPKHLSGCWKAIQNIWFSFGCMSISETFEKYGYDTEKVEDGVLWIHNLDLSTVLSLFYHGEWMAEIFIWERGRELTFIPGRYGAAIEGAGTVTERGRTSFSDIDDLKPIVLDRVYKLKGA